MDRFKILKEKWLRRLNQKGALSLASLQDNPKLKSALKDNRIMVLLISIGLAILATLVVNLYVKAKIFQVSGGQMVQTVFATDDISKGDLITKDGIALRPTPQSYLHYQSVQGQHENIVLGQQALVDIKKDQAILWTDIYLEDRVSLSQKLQPGDRAMTLKVDSVNSIAGLVRPGDRIDVMGIFHERSEKGDVETTTKVILQNVIVLAVGGKMTEDKLYLEKGDSKKSFFGSSSDSGDASKIRTLTLKVTSEEAGILAFAQEKAEIRLILRSRSDIFVETIPNVRMSDVLKFNSAYSSKARQKKEGYPTIIEGGFDQGSVYWPSKGNQNLPSLEPIVQKELKNSQS